MTSAPLVSIVIKSFNEEHNIERALRCAVTAIDFLGYEGEVILADSLSTDGTVEKAKAFPVRIVQLGDPEDRCCAVAAELGMRAARGQYIYVLDADMELDPNFLPAALSALDSDRQLAGVAGIVEDVHVSNYAFRSRVARGGSMLAQSEAVHLDGGALYRRSAIEAVGYLTNRNLHANEELELGVRLVSAGWCLQRLGKRAVLHYGHTDSSYALLLRRWRSRYLWGHGEVIRQALGRPHLGLVIVHLRVLRAIAFTVLVWSFAVGAAWFSGFRVGLLVGLLSWSSILALLTVKKRSAGAALYSIASWHVSAFALIAGFLRRPRGDPAGFFQYRVLK